MKGVGSTLCLQITEGFANWYVIIFWYSMCSGILSYFTLPVTFITIFSIKFTYVVVIILYFKTATSTHHCTNHHEGWDWWNIKMRVLCQWRNETKLSTNWKQTVKPDCHPVILSFTAKLPHDELGTQWKCLWKCCLCKDAWGVSPRSPFDKYRVPPGRGSSPVVSPEMLRTSPVREVLPSMPFYIRAKWGRERARNLLRVTQLARLTPGLDSEPVCFTPSHTVKGFTGASRFVALCFTVLHGYCVF